MGNAAAIIIPLAIGFATGGIAFTMAAGFTFTSAGAMAVLSAVLAGASMILAPKPEMPDFGGLSATNQDRTQSFKQPITNRTLSYGLLKAGGAVVYIGCSPDGGEKNAFLHMVVAHTTGEIRSIAKWWVNGIAIAPADLDTGLPTGGTVDTGRYANLVRIQASYGSTTQDANADLVSESPQNQWTSAHRLQGIFYNYFRFKFDKDVFQSVPSVACEFYGSKGIYDPRTSAASTTIAQEANSALVLRDYLTNSYGLGCTTDFIDDTNFATAANVCDELVQYWDADNDEVADCNLSTPVAAGMQDNIDQSTFTFQANVGDPSTTSVDRVICIAAYAGSRKGGSSGSAISISNITIGGVGATIHNTVTSGVDEEATAISIGSVVNNTAVSKEVVVTTNVDAGEVRIQVFSIYESDGTVSYKGTATTSDSDFVAGISTTLQFPAGAAVVCAAIKGTRVIPDPDDPDTWSGDTYVAPFFDGYQVDGAPETHAVRNPWTNRSGWLEQADSLQFTQDYKLSWWGLGVNKTGSTVLNTTFGVTSPQPAETCLSAVVFNAANQQQSHARYQAHGMTSTATSMKKNIENILTSMCGQLIYSGGKFKVLPASPAMKAMDLSESDFVGDVQISPQLSRRDNFNTVQGTYISPLNNYQPSNYPTVTSAVFKAQDNDEELFRDFVLAFTTDEARAQRIAKIALFTNRQPLTFKSTLKLTAFQLDVGDVVAVSLDKYGWSEKLFSVTSYAFAQGGEGLNIAAGFKEYSDETFDWTSTDQEVVESAPNTILPVFTTISRPSNLVATETLVTSRDARGVQSLLSVTFDAVQDAFVNYYEMEYKKSTDSTYISGGQSTARLFEILDLAPAIWNIRVKAINVFGSESSYNTLTKETTGLLAAPSAMTNLSEQDIGGMCFLQWDLSTDLDVRIGGHVEVRFQNVSSGATWLTSQLVDVNVTGNTTSCMVPLREGTYLLKFVDGSGIKQASATSVVSDGATILAFTDDETVTENPSFAGTKTSCHVDTSYTPDNLVMNAGGTIDSYSENVDTIDNWDFLGGVATSATYEFASKMDHGSVLRIRLTSNISSTIFVPGGTNIDSRSALVDTWEDWDETGDATPANVEMYYAHTANDPASATDWSVWKRFTQREERARGIKFKLEFTNVDAAYNVRVSALNVVSAVI